VVGVVSVEELRGLSAEERAELLRALIALGDEDPLELPRYRRRRGLVLVFLLACCAWLIPWTVVLGLTLPQHYTAGQWSAAWIGFDAALTAAFAFTAFAVWRRLQMAILGQIVTGTLLVCDAWFDVMLSWGSGEFVVSVVTALFGEVPLAVLMFVGARTLVLTTVRALWVREGRAGPVPRLREVRLVTIGRSVGGGG
jgi:hypothetical protein